MGMCKSPNHPFSQAVKFIVTSDLPHRLGKDALPTQLPYQDQRRAGEDAEDSILQC